MRLAVALHLDAMTAKRVFYDPAKTRIHGRKHGFRAANQRHLQSAMRECVRHFKPDITGAHDYSRMRLLFHQIPVHAKAVLHGVQRENARTVDPRNLRDDRTRAGSDQQCVVGNCFLSSDRIGSGNRPAGWVEGPGHMIGQKLDPIELRPMRELPPVGRLAAEVKRQAADAVIRKGVSQDNRDVCRGIQLARA